jgi:two-component system, NtrC family, sensor histidine kinase KinB
MRTFRQKIFMGFGASLILMVLILAWAMFMILRLGQASESILRENYRSIQAAEHMIDAIERQDAAVLLYLLGYKEQGLKEFRENEAAFQQWLGRARDNITISGEKEIVDSVEENYGRYVKEVYKLHLLGAHNQAAAINLYHEVILPHFRSTRDTCVKLREINHETMYATSTRAGQLSVQAVISMLAIGTLSVIIAIVFSLFLSRLISRPVTELKEAALQIAEGNYDVQVPAQSSAEMALLAQQFNQMAQKLKKFHEMNIEQIIAEKLKSEAIIQSVDDGIIVVDDQMVINNINPKAALIFGMHKDSLLGRHFVEAVRDEHLFALLKQSLETGRPPQLHEGEDMFTISSEGGSQHYQFSILPMRSSSGIIQGVVLLLRDITRLRELDRLKSEFVLTASHELRTPLTSVSMAVELLMESAAPKLTDKEKELLTACHEDVQRLRALVNDLLDLSRIEAGKVALSFEQVLPSVLVDQALAVIRPQTEAKHIELTSEIPPDLPKVAADPNKIVWVLVNLLANAVRHTPEGGHIKVKGERLGGQVHLSVTDDGEGVPYDIQSRIFDKFIQVKRDSDIGGSGLGLAISKEVVRAHRGTIWLDSVPAQGSTFTFTIPVAD